MSRLTELARGNATGGVALLILFVACGTIAGAWTIEAMGYIPCELCLLGRKPYYIGIALAALTVFAAWGAGRNWRGGACFVWRSRFRQAAQSPPITPASNSTSGRGQPSARAH